MSYYLKVYDNFNYMEEDEVYYVKGIGTQEQALKKARAIVESYFAENWKPGMDHTDVKAMYSRYGKDPVIFSDTEENIEFSGWKYAEQVALRMALKNAGTPQKIYQLVIKYVADKHKDQKVKGSDLPYLVHLSNVAMEIMVASPHSKSFDLDFALKVALLHDVVEDMAVPKEEMDSIFGTAVLDAVNALSKNKSLPKQEQIVDSLNRIKNQPKEVWAVKLADRITNLQPPPKEWSLEKRKEYVEEAMLFHEQLHKGNVYLGARLKSMIEEYKAYINNSISREPGNS